MREGPTERGTLGMLASAKYLDIGLTLLKQLLATGEIPSFTVGRRRLVSQRALDRWIERRETAE